MTNNREINILIKLSSIESELLNDDVGISSFIRSNMHLSDEDVGRALLVGGYVKIRSPHGEVKITEKKTNRQIDKICLKHLGLNLSDFGKKYKYNYKRLHERIASRVGEVLRPVGEKLHEAYSSVYNKIRNRMFG